MARRSPVKVRRDIVGSQELSTGKFDVNFRRFDATGDAADAGVSAAANDAARAGEGGTINFLPSASAPKSSSIHFLQVARLTNPNTGELIEFNPRGSRAPLNEMRSRPEEIAEGGYFVDHLPEYYSKRTRKSDPVVQPYYDNPLMPAAPGNRTGSNVGPNPSPAGLEDKPGAVSPTKYEMISTAKASDTGASYGNALWGFEVYIERGKAKVRNENVKFSLSEGNETSAAAVKAFDEYYRNPGASTAPTAP